MKPSNIRKIIVQCVLLAVVYYGQAQNVSIGPTLGFNAATTSDNSNAKILPAFNLGVFLNYSTKTDFGLNAAALYSRLGNKVKNSDNYLQLNYLQIPVHLVYYLGEGMQPGAIRPKLMLGPYVGFLLDAKTPGFSQQQTMDLLNNLDYGLNLGAGLNFALAKKRWINIEAKYGIGLTAVSKISDNQNRNLSINAGISFPLGNYDIKTGVLKK